MFQDRMAVSDHRSNGLTQVDGHRSNVQSKEVEGSSCPGDVSRASIHFHALLRLVSGITCHR